MTSNKSFPTTEPPPHPGNTVSNTGTQPEETMNVDPKLTDAMIPSVPTSVLDLPPDVSPVVMDYTQGSVQKEVVQPQPLSQPQPLLPQEAKVYMPKKIPKLLLVVLGVFGLLAIITIIGLFFKRDQPITLVGTKGELTWWGIENSEAVVKPLIDEYVSKNPNVKITYIQQARQDYRERLTSSLAQGKGPDIFEIHNSWVPMFTTELAVIPGNIMSTDDYSKSFYPVVTKDFVTTKGIVAIPLEYDALTLFYNQDIFDSAALPVPETWDEVSEVSSKLTQNGGTDVILQAGVGLGLTQNVDYWQDIIALMIIQNGAPLDLPNEKALDAINFYVSFFIDKPVWNSSLPSSVSAFSKNKLAMLFAPSKAARDILLENPSLRFKTSVMPQLPKNAATDPDFAYASYLAQAVWSRSKNTEVAWDFLRYLSQSENLQKMNSLRLKTGFLELIYPRPEMAILQKEDKILGSVIALAGKSTSWYLADKTFDGPTGVNSQIADIFKSVTEKAIEKKDLKKDIVDLPVEIKSVLSKYTQKK